MLSAACLTIVAAAVASAHVLITYPGSRGNNFITNSSFPYGMQWDYPCGGILATKNRTFWPTTGGAVALQPGWFQGHSATNLIYMNLGFGTNGWDGGPPNMSFPMIQPIQIVGPAEGDVPGSFCLPQVPLPVNQTVRAGDKGTIQVVELPMHGAALYSCVDIEFAEPGDPRIAEVNESNCFNSQDIGLADLYTITTIEPVSDTQTSGVETVSFWYMNRHKSHSVWRLAGWLPVVFGGLWVFL